MPALRERGPEEVVAQQEEESRDERRDRGSAADGAEAAADAGCCLAEASFGGLDCFVATAAHGRGDHPDLDALRAFRDRVLRRSVAGRLLCRLYYRWGAHLARAIRGRPLACLIVREGLVRPLACLARRMT